MTLSSQEIMPKIIFLGTSASIPTKQRDNTSFLFIYKKKTFLIDCPGSIAQKLLKVNVDFRKLKNIIITHQHPDHIYGIVSLIHTQMFFNKLLTIFTNSECIKIIKTLVKIFRLNTKHYPKIKYVDVFKNKIFFKNQGLLLSAFKNQHISGSFGIKFEFDKKILFYSSDTAFSEKLLNTVGKIDYLIHDCTASSYYFKKYPRLYKMHTSTKNLIAYLEKNKNIKLIPIHFLLVGKGEENRIKDELKILKDRVIFVRDFQVINLL